jgi:lysophospholipase L1-like esterase
MATVRKKRLRRILLKIALVPASLVIALLSAEGLLWLIEPKPDVPVALFYTYDPQLGWKKKPNLQKVIRTCEYTVIQKTNSRGFLGPDTQIEKPRETRRVVMLGDSFTEGYTVEYTENVSQVLERELNLKGHAAGYEVINLGIGAYSTDQELLVFRNTGKQFCPDVTVVMFYHNDVWANHQPRCANGAYKPMFEFAAAGLTLRHIPVPAVYYQSAASMKERLTARRYALFQTKNWLRINSRLYRKTTQSVQQNPSLHALAVKTGFMKKSTISPGESFADDESHVPGMYRVWKVDASSEVDTAWRKTEAILELLRNETASVGSDLIVFYIPVSGCIYPDRWTRMKTKYGFDDAGWDVELASKKLTQICERLRIGFINPIESYRAEAKTLNQTDETLYFPRDGHWNRHGHRLAGEILAEHIFNEDS